MSDKANQHPLDDFSFDLSCVDNHPNTELPPIIEGHSTQSHITEEQNENNAIPTKLKLIEKMIKSKRGMSKKTVHSKSKKPSKTRLVEKPKKTQQDRAKKIQHSKIKTTKRKEKTDEEKREDIRKKMKDQSGPVCVLRPEMDIVCERGDFGNENPCNKVLVLKIKSALPEYNSASPRKGRGAMFTDFFTEVKARGGRFLARIDKTKQEWREIKDKAGREKISHLFRDEARKARKAETFFAALEMVAI
ncbi:unnamed protein product [Cylindrotheca closterium]|uniref:DUF6824 domain-containing protein n=1 Tax=Cylindrotheca closterium TaxID=2856 RepID=A0AAD2G2H4_9STRA|nr:unnamed protein product [Cylindrotheca closterium]